MRRLAIGVGAGNPMTPGYVPGKGIFGDYCEVVLVTGVIVRSCAAAVSLLVPGAQHTLQEMAIPASTP